MSKETYDMGPPPQYPQSGYPPQHQGGYPPQGVVTGQPVHTTTIITQAALPRPSSYLPLAIFTCLCCNVLFGIIAIVFSVQSSSAADNGDMEAARSHGRVSMWLSIAGIIISVVLIIIIIIYFTVFAAAAVSTLCDQEGINC